MADKIMIFIPMYNCEKQIGRVLARFSPEIQRHFSEIVVIDNISQDKSLSAAKDGLRKLTDIKTTLLRNNNNYSLGGSHKVAFDYAISRGYDYCVVLHGDDQGNIEDLIPYIEKGEHTKYDSFLGARFARGSKLVGYSKFRTYGNLLFNFGISCVMRKWITDMGSGLNIYKTAYLKKRFFQYFPNNLTFNVYMLYYSVWAKSSFAFFPLTWSESDQVSNAKIFKQAGIILLLTIQYLFKANTLFSGKDNEYSKISYTSTNEYYNEP